MLSLVMGHWSLVEDKEPVTSDASAASIMTHDSEPKASYSYRNACTGLAVATL